MNELCDICKQNTAVIHIEGTGDFCLDCHNKRMLEKFNLEDSFQYADTVSVLEADGTMHSFHITHMILGTMVSWEANEIDGNYHFRDISDIAEDGSYVAQRFFRKIINGVQTKSLEYYQHYVSNVAHVNGKCYSLRQKGNIRIIENENRDWELAFEIDGHIFEPEEFAALFGPYPGFSIRYQIEDSSASVLSENEYLVPVHITGDSLIDEFETAIHACGKGNFISYEKVFAFDTLFQPILEKLKVLFASEKREDAIIAGKKMARHAAKIETDDDYFPEYIVADICAIIDPYGLDEELQALLESF